MRLDIGWDSRFCCGSWPPDWITWRQDRDVLERSDGPMDQTSLYALIEKLMAEVKELRTQVEALRAKVDGLQTDKPQSQQWQSGGLM